MVREISRDGKVWRLTKESWDILKPFDTDPNVGIQKMRDRIIELQKGAPLSAPTPAAHGCNYNEKTLKETIKSTMEEVLRPFMGS